MSLARKELDKEEAYRDCIESGTPTLGVDHSSHYKPNPYGDRTGPTLAELTRATHKAFNIQENE